MTDGVTGHYKSVALAYSDIEKIVNTLGAETFFPVEEIVYQTKKNYGRGSRFVITCLEELEKTNRVELERGLKGEISGVRVKK